MIEYLYDLHVHTKEGSACANSNAEEVARYYKSVGFSGIVITNHFFGGNTSVSSDLPWHEAMDEYCSGYETAKKVGDEIGLNVFFGIEVAYKGTEFITFGIDKNWLYKNPDIAEISPNDMLERYKNAGAFISHAHPFRERGYIKTIRLFPNLTEACEVCNTGNNNSLFDNRADWYADSYGLLKTAGSDLHSVSQKTLSGLAFSKNPKSVYELIDLIRNKKTIRIIKNEVF